MEVEVTSIPFGREGEGERGGFKDEDESGVAGQRENMQRNIRPVTQPNLTLFYYGIKGRHCRPPKGGTATPPNLQGYS
jgi:hypothetical protein